MVVGPGEGPLWRLDAAEGDDVNFGAQYQELVDYAPCRVHGPGQAFDFGPGLDCDGDVDIPSGALEWRPNYVTDQDVARCCSDEHDVYPAGPGAVLDFLKNRCDCNELSLGRCV